MFLLVSCSRKKKKNPPQTLKTLGWSNFLILQNWNLKVKKTSILPRVIGTAFAIANRDSCLRSFSTSAHTASLVLLA